MSIKPAMHPPAGRAYIYSGQCTYMWTNLHTRRNARRTSVVLASEHMRAGGTRRTTRCQRVCVLRPARAIPPRRVGKSPYDAHCDYPVPRRA